MSSSQRLGMRHSHRNLVTSSSPIEELNISAGGQLPDRPMFVVSQPQASLFIAQLWSARCNSPLTIMECANGRPKVGPSRRTSA